MLPDEASDPAIFVERFVATIIEDIVAARSLDWDIVDIGDSDVRYLRLKNVSNIIVKYRDRISPTHRKGD
jgi:hypothetical protein